MNKQIKSISNTQEEIDTDLFGQFMKKVTIWDYGSITRDSYLSLSHDEKEKLIRRYYSDMKIRSKFLLIYFFSCLRGSSCLIDALCRENL